MEHKQTSSSYTYPSYSSVSSSTSSSSYSSNWCLYGTPRIVVLEETKVENGRSKTVTGAQIHPQHLLSKKSIQSEIIRVIAPLQTAVLERVGECPTQSFMRISIIDEMRKMIEYLEIGTLPGNPCYLNSLPKDVLVLVLSFITPRELRCVQGVSRSFNDDASRLIIPSIKFYCRGRIAYFAFDSQWLLGIILCVIDTIEQEEPYTEHKGYHVYTLGGGVTYVTQNEIARFSFIGYESTLPQYAPAPIIRNVNDTPYGNGPHVLCGHGYYHHTCGRRLELTAPSSCLVLDNNYTPPIYTHLVGQVISVDKFQLHPNHMHNAIYQKIAYGVSYESVRSRDNVGDDDYSDY